MKKNLSYLKDLFPKNKWIRSVLLITVSFHMLVIYIVTNFPYSQLANILETMFFPIYYSILSLLIISYPILTTVINIKYCLDKTISEREIFFLKINDLLTFVVGSIFSKFVIEFFMNSDAWYDWQKQIYSYQSHSPIWTPAIPTIIITLILGIVGYMILAYLPAKKTPPLLLVIGLSLSYIGIVVLIITSVQLMVIWLFTLNIILIYFRLIRQTIINWQSSAIEPSPKKKWRFRLYHFLKSSFHWHILAVLFLLPILTLALMILVLFGQEPDYIIKAWTNTSDWTLSNKISPPSIEVDQHYLCTVGAAGHRSVVKPLRMGVRHGHRIVVNRQLLVANAFEQVLEEKIPRCHRFIRSNYDKYGYPIARHIKKAWQADIIYFCMKPAEYFFLIILYLVDSKPENRIALQYINKP